MTVQEMTVDEKRDHLAKDLAEMMVYLTTQFKGLEFDVATYLARQLGAYVSIVSKDNDNGKFIVSNLGAIADIVRNHDYRQTRADHFGYKLGVDESQRPRIVKPPKLVIAPAFIEGKEDV